MANLIPTAAPDPITRGAAESLRDPRPLDAPGAGFAGPTASGVIGRGARGVGTGTWTGHLVSLSGLVVLALLTARLYRGGLPVQTDYPHATTVLLDAGARIIDGQIPYQDFHTPIGFAYLGLVAGFMQLAHGLPHALAMLSAVCGFAVGVWTWWVARARCAAPVAAVLALLGGLLVATPALFAVGVPTMTYGGHYSRLAWGLLFAVVVQAALPLPLQVRVGAEAAGKPNGWAATIAAAVEGFGLGACLGLLFAIKFTFCFAGIIIVAAAWWYRRPDHRVALAIPFGAAGAIALGLAASGATLGGYLHDCASLGGAVPLPVLLMEYRRKLDFVAVALVAAMAWWTWPLHRQGWHFGWRQPLPAAVMLAGLTFGLGLVLSATTGIEDASPCYLFTLVVLAFGSVALAGEAAPTALPTMAAERRHGAYLFAIAACAACAVRLAMPIVTGPYAAASQQLTLTSGPWRGLDFLPNVPGVQNREQTITQVWIQPRNLVDNLWYLYLADGERLLRPRMAAGEKVISMDYVNPFPYLLERPAPRGDLLYWSFDRNVSAKNAPAPEVLFADAAWVMVPKIEIFHDSAAKKVALYKGWIGAHCHLEASSEWWECYRIEKGTSLMAPAVAPPL